MPKRPAPHLLPGPPAGPAATTAAEPQVQPYRPITRSRVLLIVVLTLATVALLAVGLLRPHMLLMNAKAARADAALRAACPPGAASAAAGCPGGELKVLVLPAGTSR